MLYHLLDTRVRLSARDEPEWVSFVLEMYTKPKQTKKSRLDGFKEDYF